MNGPVKKKLDCKATSTLICFLVEVILLSESIGYEANIVLKSGFLPPIELINTDLVQNSKW